MESFHLSFGLSLGHRISSHTDNLSKTLQTKKMSTCSSKRLAKLTVQVPQNVRNEHLFNSFYSTVVKKSTECEFSKDPINPRERKSPNYSTMHLIDGTASEAQYFHPITYQDRYRVMYYNVLDTAVTSLKNRFNQFNKFCCLRKYRILITQNNQGWRYFLWVRVRKTNI